MEDARAMARSSKAGRVARLVGANNSSASVMASEGADGTPVTGGVSGGSNGTAPAGSVARGRLDKPRRARGGSIKAKGKTNVTVIVAPQGGQGGADPLSAAMGAKMGALAGGGPPAGAMPPPAGGPPMPPPAGASPPPPPQQPPQRPPMAGQPVPMRKRGGAVKTKRMVDGAGSGLGRIADASAEKAFLRASGGAAKSKSGPCWSGYQAVGTKKMGKRSVPDCRPT